MCKLNIKSGDTRIDPCMRPLIKFLKNKYNYNILACCCGHERYPMTIVVESILSTSPLELLSNTYLPRKKRFYVRDKRGCYYIPEVLAND